MIGNYLIYHSDTDEGDMICQIDADDILNIDEDPEYALMHSPIKLTEEILLKAGFEKKLTKLKGDVDYIDYRIDHFALFILPKGIIEVEYYALNDDITMEERTYLVTIKFVHQLQNLHFILLGKELKIELCK